jgi:guanosine-3',5'-bis(diphosphate) 3'-pyrophosphohydrolase
MVQVSVRAGKLDPVELFTHWHTWDEAEPELRRALPPETAVVIAEAAAFATLAHGDQRRPTGVPYIEHLLETLEVLVRGAEVTDPDILAAGVLHDVIEDTERGAAEIEHVFGARTATLVRYVTKPELSPGQDRRAAKLAYLKHLKDIPDDDAVTVKLADRVSNVQTLRNLPGLRWQREYYADTVTYLMPLTERSEPWFTGWYAAWAREFADLGGGPPGPADQHPDQQ